MVRQKSLWPTLHCTGLLTSRGPKVGYVTSVVSVLGPGSDGHSRIWDRETKSQANTTTTIYKGQPGQRRRTKQNTQ